MIELITIPTKDVNEVWKIVQNDIANALNRSNGYALADHIKKWILENKMQLLDSFGIQRETKNSKVLWSSRNRNNTTTITTMLNIKI